jgi:two-component system nitrate/nitrite response regulator NarL
MPTTRVLVADALPIFRSGVSKLLLRENEFEVVEAASLDDFARLAGMWPEIVLLDADLPPRGGLAAVAWLSEHCDSHTIVWSLDPAPGDILEMIRAGARGYLRKDISPRGLMRSLRGVVRGEAPLSRDLAMMMIEALHGFDERERARDRASALSTRERQVLDLVAQGAQNKQIAQALSISEFTVKRHVQNILEKLAVPSRRAAADFYLSAYTGGSNLYSHYELA